MNIKNLQPKAICVIAIILCFAIVRILFPNVERGVIGFSFLGAIAVFGGATFKNKYLAFLLPIAIIFCSDLFINRFTYENTMFYKGWQYTYIAFLAMSIISSFIVKNITITNVMLGAIVTTVIHWLITSVPYAFGGLNITTNLPMTGSFQDIITAHIQAIPFEWPLLVGTIVYSAVMFGIYNYVQKNNPKLTLAKA